MSTIETFPDKSWNEQFKIHSYETDVSGKATVATLCNYFQEIAGNHATHLGVGIEHLNEDSKTWVLSRLKVNLNTIPFSGETVRVETWPCGVESLLALRCFRLWNRNDVLLAQAYSAWVIIDLNSRRPVRIPEEIVRLRPTLYDSFDMDLRTPLPKLSEVAYEKTLKVRRSDMDINRHVNNVHYIEWGMEALPEEFAESANMKSLEIQFRAECGKGDHIKSQIQSFNTSHILHRITKEPDGEILALMRTRWKMKNVN